MGQICTGPTRCHQSEDGVTCTDPATSPYSATGSARRKRGHEMYPADEVDRTGIRLTSSRAMMQAAQSRATTMAASVMVSRRLNLKTPKGVKAKVGAVAD